MLCVLMLTVLLLKEERTGYSTQIGNLQQSSINVQTLISSFPIFLYCYDSTANRKGQHMKNVKRTVSQGSLISLNLLLMSSCNMNMGTAFHSGAGGVCLLAAFMTAVYLSIEIIPDEW